MAKRKKTKRNNYILKDPLNLFAAVVVLFSVLLKELFLYHECGSFGIGLYNACIIFMTLVALILILAVKEAMEKAVSFRKSRGQVKNALQFIRLNSEFAFLIGAAGAVLLILVRSAFSYILTIQALGNLIMFFLAVSLPFVLLNSSYIGAFDAWGYTMPLNSGLIVFAVSDFLFSVLCSILIGKAGNINSLLFHNEQMPAAFFCGGAALGLLISSVITSVWLSMLFKIFRGNIKIEISDEFGKNYESIHDQKLGFLLSLGIPALNNILIVLPYLLSIFFAFQFYPETDKNSADHIISVFGTISIQFFLWQFLPLSFAGLLAKHSKDSLKYITARDDRYHGSMRLVFMIKQFLCFVLPAVCFVGLVSGDLTKLLFGSQFADVLFLTILLFALVSFSVLISAYMTGFEMIPSLIISRTISLAAEFMYLFFVVRYDCTMVNLMIAMIIYFGCIVFLNLIQLNKYFVYKKQLFRHIVIPVISFAAFALCSYFILIMKNKTGFLLAAVLALLISCMVQSAILVLTGAVRENEIQEYPQKMLLNAIGHLFHKY